MTILQRSQASAAASSRPSGTRRSTRAHWRPSRIAQTTSDWPRRMSPQAKILGTRGLVVDRRCALTLPRGSSSTPRLLDHARLARAQEAHRQQHEVGLELELAARRPPASAMRPSAPFAHSTRTHSSAVDLAVLADGALGQHREVALARLPRATTRCAASAASPARSAPCSRCSGGCGMISSWVTEAAPWRFEVPMQSEPVSPPPITTTCLPLARERAAWARRAPRRRRRRACSAGSGNPWRNGCRRARGPGPRGRAALRRRRSAPPRHSLRAAT